MHFPPLNCLSSTWSNFFSSTVIVPFLSHNNNIICSHAVFDTAALVHHLTKGLYIGHISTSPSSRRCRTMPQKMHHTANVQLSSYHHHCTTTSNSSNNYSSYAMSHAKYVTLLFQAVLTTYTLFI
jgi:hypothetical protein